MRTNLAYKQRKQQSDAAMKHVINVLEEHGRHVKKATSGQRKDHHFDLFVDSIPVKWKMTHGDYTAIPFEIVNGGHPSWFVSTVADLFYYYMEASRTVYVIDINETRKFVKQTHPKKRTSGSFGGVYYLLPLKDLKMNGLVRETVYV